MREVSGFVCARGSRRLLAALLRISSKNLLAASWAFELGSFVGEDP